MGWLQIDHVIPVAKNGSDDLDNKNQVVSENEVIAVETKTALEPSAYEQALLGIVRALPPERVVQILDYARYIESQAGEDFGILHDDETLEEVIADEAQWEAQFAETQGGLKKMAEKVREDIRAGRTPKMVFKKDGRIAPG
jgi:tRNA isopentenyl-2-thiomethyl-A-37 hydroxylase MiaE